MSEHDDDGSAVTLPLLLLPPPPPPQPAARSASTAVTPITGASETRFLTCPPRSLDAVHASTGARVGRGGWPSIGPFIRIFQVAFEGAGRCDRKSTGTRSILPSHPRA